VKKRERDREKREIEGSGERHYILGGRGTENFSCFEDSQAVPALSFNICRFEGG
jgi:hypothetical protein